MGEELSYNVTFKAIKGDMPTTTSAAFGSLEWVSGKYSVRSPLHILLRGALDEQVKLPFPDPSILPGG
ncbi:hypothetical protein PHJA_002218600 [Phtheirospermum japonicum]|uniref:Subtilisin-like protease fibronectin type-III domain-containing protein n=1 Tax=Phtheirospermum japonicum TaxID=374723 RepID=A0A830CN52_9LAMI|nr:hypothetical protein PHJA_002218600 [Phtheirospermum japonicum]